jgi:hypothetical protein
MINPGLTVFLAFSDIAALGSLLRLHNLNLKGNPIANKKDYLEKVKPKTRQKQRQNAKLFSIDS